MIVIIRLDFFMEWVTGQGQRHPTPDRGRAPTSGLRVEWVWLIELAEGRVSQRFLISPLPEIGRQMQGRQCVELPPLMAHMCRVGSPELRRTEVTLPVSAIDEDRLARVAARENSPPG